MFNTHALAYYVHLHAMLLRIGCEYRTKGNLYGPSSARYLQDACNEGAACMVQLHAACDNAWEPELAVFV